MAGRFKYIYMILISIFLTSSSPVMADDQLSGILEGIKKMYGNLPGLSVTYKREIISSSMAMLGDQMKGDLATGQIYFKPPHFLRVQQETPKEEAVITDGDTLWWYIPEKKQVHRYPSHQLGQELRLLGDIFQGLRGVEESFQVIQTDIGNKKIHQLKLIPNPPWEQIDYITLSVNLGDCHIRILEIHNYIGGMTRFILGDPVIREEFEENFFKFMTPEGVRVIEGEG